MKLNYILLIAGINGEPVYAAYLKNHSKEYYYYPFEWDGFIYTADLSMWQKSSNSIEIEGPSLDESIDFLGQDGQNNYSILIKCGDEMANLIEESRGIDLIIDNQNPNFRFQKYYEFYGYDVIDLSGVSSICNIGYSEKDLNKMPKISFNENGLLKNYDMALKFSDFSKEIIAEHAPFFPVEVWIKRGGRLKMDKRSESDSNG